MASVSRTPTLRMRMSQWLAWFEALAGTRRGAVVLFAVALAVFAVQSIAMPVAGGRDFGSYLAYYVQMWDSRPANLTPLVARTPIAPLAIGVPLDIGGVATVVWMALLYAGSVIAWSWVALSFGRRAALATAALLLLYPGYGILFHGLSSDPIFAAAFAGWAVLLTRATLRPSWGRFLLVGLGIAFLAGIRPGNQVLALFVVFPLLLAGQWRSRLTWAAALLAGIVIPLGALAVNNGVRYGNYEVAGGASTFGLFRMFVTDRIIQPENGPLSREFARGVKRYLLPEEPYRSYGITSDEFFSSGSLRMQADVGWVASRLWGDAAEGKLRALMWEAISSHPGAYTTGVSRSMWDLLWRLRLWVPVASSGDGGDSGSRAGAGGVVNVGGRTLPRPTEGEPIPAPHGGQVLDLPDRAPSDPLPRRRGGVGGIAPGGRSARAARSGARRQSRAGSSSQPSVSVVSGTARLASAGPARHRFQTTAADAPRSRPSGRRAPRPAADVARLLCRGPIRRPGRARVHSRGGGRVGGRARTRRTGRAWNRGLDAVGSEC